MNIREMRTCLGDTQKDFSERYHIPLRTIQNWEAGRREPPAYILELLEERVLHDAANRKTIKIPSLTYDPNKMDLPDRRNFLTGRSWLREIQNILGNSFVFGLDSALICQNLFLGRYDQYWIWGYGDDSATMYNGVILLSNSILNNVVEENGLRYTDFNRTLSDALDNEDILDMQGITEALSKYYYTHDDSFEGLCIPPRYQNRFESLADDAIHYYDS